MLKEKQNDPAPSERTPWWASIVTRLTLVVALLISAAALLSGWLVYRSGSDQLVKGARQAMDHSLAMAEERFNAFSGTLASDITFLADNEPLNAYAAAVDSGDTALLANARERLALLMESFLRSRTQYTQVRVIAADGPGTEAIRFDRIGARVLRVSDSALQVKGDRAYYLETMRLPPGASWFSPIDLNREHGRVQLPWMPTVRAAAPLFAHQRRRAGIVVINADVRSLFADLRSVVGEGEFMVADRSGEVILHPDTAAMFRFEFGGTHPLQWEVERFNGGPERAQWISAQRTIEPAGLSRCFNLLLARDTTPLLADMRRERDRDLLIAGAVALGFILLTALFAGGIASSLSRLTRRVERHASGATGEQLPWRRNDEIGRLARSLELMRQRIDRRVEGIDQARLLAEGSDRRQREFLANMSHEVRTPLNAIIGLSTDLDKSALNAGDRERLALVQRSALRLKGLVDDLLLQARIGEGRLELKRTDVDLRQLVNDVAQAHRPAAEAKSIALRIDTTKLPPAVWTDPLRMHQVIDNLVGNAIKFTATGQVDVSARQDEEGVLHIAVSDTGPGLPPEQRTRIFERFEQAASSEKESGAGLGLAITKRLVELMGGAISVESDAGRGSRFIVAIPPVEREASSPGSIDVDSSALAGLRVLYVEDVASNRMVLEHWASKWKWDLTQVPTAEDAIKVGAANAFDLALLDLDLGEGMRGSQLGMRLRGSKHLRYVPMLAVTAYVGEEQEEEILKAGLNDRVTKPLDRQELLRAINYWCGTEREDAPAPTLARLEAQYDGDAEKLISVLQQYRRECTQWRISLRAASHATDGKAIADVHHKLTPHAELLGMSEAFDALRNAAATLPEAPAIDRAIGALRACDRALMSRQRELQAATTGRAS